MKKKITAGILSAIMIAGALSTGMAVHAAEPRSNFISGSLIAAARKELEAKKAAYKAMCDTIDKTIDKITQVKTETGKKPQTIGEYITLCKEDFDVITAYGKDALPYLAKMKDDSKKALRTWMIMVAQYQIDPSIYDPTVVSPDGKYTFVAHSNLTEYAGTLWNSDIKLIYPSISVYENGTGKELKTFTGMSWEKVDVLWSPDSRFVAMNCGYVGSPFSYPIMFDIGGIGRHTLYLPFKDVFEYIAEDSGKDLSRYVRIMKIKDYADYEEDGTVRIDFALSGINSGERKDYLTGHYYYDPAQRTSSEPVYEFVD
ncbi:MAG: hypothetical protein SPF08_13085 [Candidatus Flemingibacterium sp.]|nr:hypothetical protein [Candidatus Flemingibacterium sp.]